MILGRAVSSLEVFPIHSYCSLIIDLRAISQNYTEPENSFAKRINDAFERFGIVQSCDEVLRLFIDGLQATIPTLVARHPESHRRSTYV